MQLKRKCLRSLGYDDDSTVRRWGAAAVVALALLLVGHAAGADKGKGDKGAVRLLKTIPVPVDLVNTTNGLYSFDISFVDEQTQTYYLADRSNVAVDVVDAKTSTFIEQISVSPSFAGVVSTADCQAIGGANCSGPNGVVAAYPWLFVTDGDSRVVNIDLRTGNIAPGGDVVTANGDPNRADELAYAPKLGLLLVINPNGTPPFGTLIHVNKATGQLTIGTRITFDAAHGVDATNGAEQPVWDPSTSKFYLSIPEISGNKTNLHGAVLRISTTGQVEAQYPVDRCGPAGLTLGPRQELLVGCNTVFDPVTVDDKVWDPAGTVTAAPKEVILNVQTGSTTDVPGVGAGDEVWFDTGDGKYYATGSGSPLRPLPAATAQGASVLGVIDAENKTLLQLVPTFNVPAVTTGNNQHPAGTAHSVAVNAKNNHAFVPLAANNVFPDCLTGCIAVYGSPSEDDEKD